MKRFCAKDGYLHFLFAGEDDYYLDSLVRLDLGRYLYYCLKRAGYEAVYFLGREGDSLLVSMEDKNSLKEFPREGGKGFLGLKFPLSARTVTENGRSRYELVLPDLEDWMERLGSLLRRKGDAYAFVVPIDLFFTLFRDEGRSRELAGMMKDDRQNSIFLVTASLRADFSMDYLMREDGPFHSRLCPEVLRITGKARKVLLYEEMERELGSRYLVLNQLRKRDILRMLRYRMLICGKEPFLEEREMNDTAELIWFWHHSPMFAAGEPELFPENEEHQLKVIAGALEQPGTWPEIRKKLAEIREGRPEELSVAEILGPDYPVEERFQPRRKPSGTLQRLQRFSVPKLIGEEGTVRCRQLSRKLSEIQKDMRRVYSTERLRGDEDWLEMCLDEMQELEEQGYQDADAVERILNFMDYLVVKDERIRRPELFEQKAEYYCRILEMSAEVLRTGRTVKDYEARAGESRRQMREKMQEILRKEQEMQSLKEETETVLAKPSRETYSGEFLSLSAEKEEVVRLDEESRNLERLAANRKNQIVLYRKAIRQLEMSIEEISGKDLKDISSIVQNAAGAVKKKTMREARLAKELTASAEEYQAVQEEAQEAVAKELPATDLEEEFARIAECAKLQSWT